MYITKMSSDASTNTRVIDLPSLSYAHLYTFNSIVRITCQTTEINTSTDWNCWKTLPSTRGSIKLSRKRGKPIKQLTSANFKSRRKTKHSLHCPLWALRAVMHFLQFFFFLRQRYRRMIIKTLRHELEGQRVLLPWRLLDFRPLVLEPDFDLGFVQTELCA